MREKLQQIDGERKRFVGAFVRFGTKTSFGYMKETVLFQDVRRAGNNAIFADHLWLNLTKEFANIGLQEGDLILFDARVREYQKGYRGHREGGQRENPIENDYKLSHPTKVELLKRGGLENGKRGNTL